MIETTAPSTRRLPLGFECEPRGTVEIEEEAPVPVRQPIERIRQSDGPEM